MPWSDRQGALSGWTVAHGSLLNECIVSRREILRRCAHQESSGYFKILHFLFPEREDPDVQRTAEPRVHGVCQQPEDRCQGDVQLHHRGLAGECVCMCVCLFVLPLGDRLCLPLWGPERRPSASWWRGGVLYGLRFGLRSGAGWRDLCATVALICTCGAKSGPQGLFIWKNIFK